LLDGRADPGGVFLFRREAPGALRAVGVPDKPWWRQEGQGIPTVYLIDFGNPKALFQAQTIQMRDADIVYVANASSVEFGKALSLFGLSIGIVERAQNVSD
jgi:polysaccharide export outer membrane protein